MPDNVHPVSFPLVATDGVTAPAKAAQESLKDVESQAGKTVAELVTIEKAKIAWEAGKAVFEAVGRAFEGMAENSAAMKEQIDKLDESFKGMQKDFGDSIASSRSFKDTIDALNGALDRLGDWSKDNENILDSVIGNSVSAAALSVDMLAFAMMALYNSVVLVKGLTADNTIQNAARKAAGLPELDDEMAKAKQQMIDARAAYIEFSAAIDEIREKIKGGSGWGEGESFAGDPEKAKDQVKAVSKAMAEAQKEFTFEPLVTRDRMNSKEIDDLLSEMTAARYAARQRDAADRKKSRDAELAQDAAQGKAYREKFEDEDRAWRADAEQRNAEHLQRMANEWGDFSKATEQAMSVVTEGMDSFNASQEEVARVTKITTAISAAIKIPYEIAESTAAAGRYDYGSAALHALAAVQYAVSAAGNAYQAMGGGGGGGGAGGGGGGSASASAPAASVRSSGPAGGGGTTNNYYFPGFNGFVVTSDMEMARRSRDATRRAQRAGTAR